MKVAPLTIKAARAYVARWHRHLPIVRGGLFALGAEVDGRIVGVAIVGRPKARRLQDRGDVAEITRVATDGTRNACSFLYSRARRAAQILGWRRVVTYTLEEEPGSSLRGADFDRVARTRGGRWDREERARADLHPLQRKFRWETRSDNER